MFDQHCHLLFRDDVNTEAQQMSRYQRSVAHQFPLSLCRRIRARAQELPQSDCNMDGIVECTVV